MKIEKVIGREIFDSRGLPTLECELILEGGIRVLDSVPSGLSRSSFEAVDVRDEKRLFGLGVSKAIGLLETEIAPLILGKEPDLIGTDLALLELDGTDNKSRIGTNTMLAASMAICRAQAVSSGFELYDFIAYVCDYNTVSIPFPMFNMLSGGVHANIEFPIQELLVIPMGKKTFREALESAVILSFTIKEMLTKQDYPIIMSDEGAFVVDFSTLEDAFNFIMTATESTGHQYALAIDVAASHLYNPRTKKYRWFTKELSSEELINLYEQLISNYPISLIEDGLGETDEEGWKELMNRLGNNVQIVGDDLFATRTERIADALNKGIATGAIIKPNQIGTVTEALQAIKFCKEHGIQVIASHRSGETNDSFIADLAVGVSASYLKAGGCNRSERCAKYNHLLRIEDSLLLSLLNDVSS